GIRDLIVTGVQTCALPIYISLEELQTDRECLALFLIQVETHHMCRSPLTTDWPQHNTSRRRRHFGDVTQTKQVFRYSIISRTKNRGMEPNTGRNERAANVALIAATLV